MEKYKITADEYLESLESGDDEDSEEKEITTHSPAGIVRCRDKENSRHQQITDQQTRTAATTVGDLRKLNDEHSQGGRQVLKLNSDDEPEKIRRIT